MSNKQQETIKRRQELQKKLVLEQLAKVSNVQLACEKAGVGRTTLYRWVQRSRQFAQKVEEARQEGQRYMDDFAESKLFALIKENNLGAIRLYLQNRHPEYGNKLEVKGSMVHEQTLSKEDQKLLEEALRLALPDNSTAKHDYNRTENN